MGAILRTAVFVLFGFGAVGGAASRGVIDGSVVSCAEAGVVTYSNVGCKRGVVGKVLDVHPALEMHPAVGAVMPTREVSRSSADAPLETLRLQRLFEAQRIRASEKK